MAKKRKIEKQPRTMTKHQISRHEKAVRRQRITRFVGIGVIAVVVIIVLVGLLVAEILPNNKTVLKVNDRNFSYSYYEDTMQFFADQYGASSMSSMAEQLLTYISNNETLKQAAGELGYMVDDGAVKERIKELEISRNQATMDLVRAELLREKLKDEYLSEQVPLTAEQAKFEAMLLEDDEHAAEVRELVAATEDFAELAKEHGLDYNSRYDPFGVYDWHPREVAETMLSQSIPLDFAFEAEAGKISDPLPDPEASKKLGYWLLRVNERTFEEGNEEEDVPETVTADVSAILLGNIDEAEEIRQRLIAGEDLATLAEEYSEYSTSASNGGELGVLNKPTAEDSFALSEVADAYIYGEGTLWGVWSEPLRDVDFYTDGGSWIVRVVDTSEDRELSEEDRDTLISLKYNEWFTDLTEDTETYKVEKLLTTEQIQAAIEAVS